ncbi:MAG: ABC transporter ATP-binding protein [Patescibacteria group bacterium]
MAKALGKKDYINGLKTIFSYLGHHRQKIIQLSVLAVLLSLANGFAPLVTGKLFDSVVQQDNKVWFFLIGWFALLLVSNVADQIRAFRSDTLGRRLYTDYILKAYNYLLDLPLSFHKKRKIGAIINTTQTSAAALEDISSNTISNLIPQFLSILVATIVTFFINYWLGLVMFAGVAAYCVVLIRTLGPSAMLQRKSRKAWQGAWRTAHDSIDNVYSVKQMAAENYEQQKNKKNLVDRALGSQLKIYQLMNGLRLKQKVIIISTQAVVFFLAIIFIQHGGMTIGELITLNAYSGMLFGPFIILGNHWRSIENGMIALEESEKVLQLPTEKYIPENLVKLDKFAGQIEFKNVSFYYEKQKSVLKNINFQVKPGEVVALVGESGVGKSTLIDLLSGYNFARTGQVLIDGVNIKRLDLKKLRSQIAVVPQEVVLFSDTIETNIKYGNFDASRKEVEEAAKLAHALDFINRMPKKWKQIVGERGYKLSVGEKQRVAIARAILRDPKILILDEPTSALDAKSEKIIQESLEELMKNRTTFIIAHRLSTVRRADKILVFKDGEIVETGKHDELLKIENGVYRHLYELQIGLHQ